MTISTVFATAPGGSGTARSGDATYATARTTFGATQDLHLVGQRLNAGNYFCYESFLIFDTSGIADTDTVSAVVLSLDGNTDVSTTDFTARAAASAYDGGAVASGDWISGASLGALTVLASWASSGYSAGYNAFTETADFKTAINLTGNTALIVWSSRHEGNNTPTGNEHIFFNDADAAGTTEDPKLDITHAAAGGTTPFLMLMGVGT